MLEEPIVVRYQWTYAEFCSASQYARDRWLRRAYRIALLSVIVPVLLGGVIVGILTKDFKSLIILFLGFVAVPVMLGWRPGGGRRSFRRRPDSDAEIEWLITADKIQQSCASIHFTSEFGWNLINEVCKTPQGYLLFTLTKHFYWFPKHGFAHEADYASFYEFSRLKVAKSREIH